VVAVAAVAAAAGVGEEPPVGKSPSPLRGIAPRGFFPDPFELLAAAAAAAAEGSWGGLMMFAPMALLTPRVTTMAIVAVGMLKTRRIIGPP